MGLLGNIKQWAVDTTSNLASKFLTRNKSTATQTQPTLNEQIENDTLGQNTPTTKVGSFANTLNNQINTGQIQQGNIQTNIPLPGLNNNVTNNATMSPATIEEQRRARNRARNNVSEQRSIAEQIEDGMPGWLTRTVRNIPSRYKNRVQTGKNETDKNLEYSRNKKRVLKGYMPTNGGLLELKSTEEDTLVNHLGDLVNRMSEASSYNEAKQLSDQFYKANRDYFKISPEYGIYDKYDDNVLNTLAGYNVNVGKYTPTEDEFWAYIENLNDNAHLDLDLSKKYNLDPDENTLSLQDDITENTLSEFRDITRGNGIYDLAEKKTKDGRNKSAFMQNFEYGVSDQVNRILPFITPIFREEQKILQKPADKRTEAERTLLAEADTVHRLRKQYAQNINDYGIRELNEGTDASGKVVDALDRFSDGSSLTDVFTNNMLDIAGYDAINGWLGHVSPIDIFQRVTNQAMYDYKMATEGNPFQRIWNVVEHEGERVGDWTSEGGQAVLRGTLNLLNVFTGKGAAASSSYFDNDVSVFKLIETDDSEIKRTLKKYALQLGEYAPEGLANVGIDLLLYGATGPAAITKTMSQFGRIGKFQKSLKAIQTVDKLRKSSRLLDRTLSATERIGALGREWSNINSKNKLVWNVIDRTLTQVGMGQLMDAQLSVFDTEPYSDTSFWLSALGSLGFDMLPEIKDLYGITRSGIKGGKSRFKSAGVWDLVDYISQSDENALAIARAMGKKYPTFSEEDLKNYVDRFAEISEAAKQVWSQISPEAQGAMNEWTKDIMYNYVKQTYGSNSNIGRQVRQILANKSTNPADIIKYLGAIGGTVRFGPYTSTITFKHGTPMAVAATSKDGRYDVALDTVLDGGFNRRVQGGFTNEDIANIAKLNQYDNLIKDKDKLFDKVGDVYYLNEQGLAEFGLKTENMTLEALGVEVSQAENVREILKEKMAKITENKLSPETINMLADGGGYDELVNRVKEVLC